MRYCYVILQDNFISVTCICRINPHSCKTNNGCFNFHNAPQHGKAWGSLMVMTVRPVHAIRRQTRNHRFLIADGLTQRLAALADALTRLDRRAGRYLLQARPDWFGTFPAFEGKGVSGLLVYFSASKQTLIWLQVATAK